MFWACWSSGRVSWSPKRRSWGPSGRRSVVENANLTVQIAALRRVLDQGRSEGELHSDGRSAGLPVPPRRNPGRVHQLRRRRQAHQSPCRRHRSSRRGCRSSYCLFPISSEGDTANFTMYPDDHPTNHLSRVAGIWSSRATRPSRTKASASKPSRSAVSPGVRYVLEGSVRRSGNQVRVNARLIDAATNTHLWAERFDHDIGDLFAVQNEITGRIANTWLAADRRGILPRTERPDALDYLLRGRAVHGTGGVRENVEQSW